MHIQLQHLSQLGYSFTAIRGFVPCGNCQNCDDGCGAEGHCKHAFEPLHGVMVNIDGQDYALYGMEDSNGCEIALLDDYPELHATLHARIHQVLWLSRHPMDEVQQASIKAAIAASYSSKFSPPKPVLISFLEINVTFPANGEAGVEMLLDLAKQYQANSIAGVIPAHIAVKAAKVRATKGLPFLGYLPVAAPASANHGEIRKYEHSHFETF